jgi:hypothetical protein
MYSGHSNRREFISLLSGAVISPLTASAQPALKRPLIAWMTGVTRGTSSPYFDSFLKGMRDLNYRGTRLRHDISIQ